MPVTVPPPTASEIRLFDRIWLGKPHRDLCVRMDGVEQPVPEANRSGKTVTVLVYTPDVEHHANAMQSDDGKLTLVSDAPIHGRVCLGIGETP